MTPTDIRDTAIPEDVQAQPAGYQRRLRWQMTEQPWAQCSTREATDMFERSPSFEYRPIYDGSTVEAITARLDAMQKTAEANFNMALGLANERDALTAQLDALTAQLDALKEENERLKAQSPQADVVAIVPPYCSGSALGFDPGTLHVSKDGSGYIAINEDDFVLEDDRCEGPDGPEGSVHWIVKLDASEIVALRHFLNGNATPSSHMVSPAGEGARTLLAAEPPLEQRRLVGEMTSTSAAAQTACLPGGLPADIAREQQAHEGSSSVLPSDLSDGVASDATTAPSPAPNALTQPQLPESGESVEGGEPYAACTIDYLGCEYLSRDVKQIEEIAQDGSHGPTEVIYLYARKERP